MKAISPIDFLTIKITQLIFEQSSLVLDQLPSLRLTYKLLTQLSPHNVLRGHR